MRGSMDFGGSKFEELKEFAIENKVAVIAVLIVLALVVAGALFFLFFPLGEKSAAIDVRVYNEKEEPISGAVVGIDSIGISGITNENGAARLVVPAGKEYLVSVSKEGFEGKEVSVTAKEEGGKSEETVILKAKVFFPIEQRLDFADASGKIIEGKELTAEFSCSRQSAEFPENERKKSTSTGSMTIAPPVGCGLIKFRADAPGFKSKSDTIYGSGVIRLESLEVEKGTLSLGISLVGKKSVPDTIKASVYSEDGLVASAYANYLGAIDFSLPAGDYYAAIEDEAGDYGSKRIDFEIKAKKTTKEEIVLDKELKIRLRVHVGEEDNNSSLKGAKVSLFTMEDGKKAGSSETGENGFAEFAISESGEYSVSASLDGYLPVEGKVKTTDYSLGEEVELNLGLEKCTPSKCGTLSVKVVDEDNLPVADAKAALFDAKTDFLLDGHGYSYTDINGYARPVFRNIPQGEYYAMAFKYPAAGKSEAFELNPLGKNETEVKMVIGDGTITVNVKDEDGEIVPFAEITFFEENGEEVGKVVANEEGYGYKVFKADRRLYARISADGYYSYVTASRQVMPNSAAGYDIVLEKEIAEEMPRIKLVGVYSENSSAASFMSAGKSYTARFLLIVPDKEYSNAGFFIRVGGQKTIERDNVYAKNMNAPQAWQMSGTSYNEPRGEDIDFGNPAGAKAKWILAEWEGISAGTREIEVEINVDKKTPSGYELPIYYRAFGVLDGDYERDPVDTSLGSAGETNAKEGLYAESYLKPFVEGAESMCDEEFCFGTRLLDSVKIIYVNEGAGSYGIRNYNDYVLSFNISNSGAVLHDNARLSIMNTENGIDASDSLEITEYSFTNADSQVFDGNMRLSEIPSLAMGKFSQYKSVKGTLKIRALKGENSGLKFSIVSNNNAVYENTVYLQVYSSGELDLNVSPAVIPALVPLELETTIRYPESDEKKPGFPVEGSAIEAEAVFPGSIRVFNGTTNAQGKTIFSLPALQLGARITVNAYKAGYPKMSLEKKATGEVAIAEPDSLDFSLNITNKRSEKKSFTITNALSMPLKIKSMRFLPFEGGALDIDSMNSLLAQNDEAIITAGSGLSADVSARLSSDADLLTEPIRLKGIIIVRLSPISTAGSATWAVGVPVDIDVGLAEMPSNDSCIVLSESEWKSATTRSNAQLQFYITNNCVNNSGEPMELQNLQGEINWSGKDGIIGNVELSISNPLTGETSSEVLQENRPSILSAALAPEVEYSALFTFTPKSGTLGKTAEFDVSINASLNTDNGKQLVGSSPQSISAEIKVINLEDCIVVDPNPQEGIVIQRRDKEDKFTVDVSECGPIDLDLRFCGGEDGDRCRGGTTEGGLNLNIWEAKRLNGEGNDKSREITVSRTSIPGLYGIVIEARPSGAGGSWVKTGILDVLVQPESGEYFEFDKYKLTLIGKDSNDAVTLTNRALKEDVDVTASVCDWPNTTEKNWKASENMKNLVKKNFFPHLAAWGIADFAIGGAAGTVSILATYILTLTYDFLKYLLDGDVCDKDKTISLSAFSINLAGFDFNDNRYLPPDALGIKISSGKDVLKGITGKYDLENIDLETGESNWKQTVGLIFNNKKGIALDGQRHGIVSVEANEHFYGNPVGHSGGNVHCSSSNFGIFWLPESDCKNVKTGKYTQKFHVRFRTKEFEEEVPQAVFDEYSCVSGTKIGRTGRSALPRIKLNWNWSEENGIAKNACDEDNEDYIYCDATQFTIELNKKLYDLHEFLEANEFDLGCPAGSESQESSEEYINEQNAQTGRSTVDPGLVGLSEMVIAKEKDSETNMGRVAITVTGKNNNTSLQSIVVKVKLIGTDMSEEEQEKPLVLSPGSEGDVEFDFTGLSENYYSLIAEITSDSSFLDTDSLGAVLAFPEISDLSMDACRAKTTDTVSGVPIINAFISANPGRIRWTAAVPNLAALDKLLLFNAYLEKDGYTEDFKKDFAAHYTAADYANAPTYFTEMGIDENGNRYGFNRLLERGNIVFTRKYTFENTIPAAGLYSVQIAAYFGENNWRLFNDKGTPKAGVFVILHRIGDAYPDSPLYAIPFDGEVGKQGSGLLDRQGYGTAYTLANGSDSFYLTEGEHAVKTEGAGSSNPTVMVGVEKKNDLHNINSLQSTRGEVLSIERTGSLKMVFSPSYATPLVMKITKETIGEEKYSAFWTPLSGNVPIDSGSSLAYWSGAGNCRDFSGIPIFEAFNETPDRKAKVEDEVGGGVEGIYGLDWENADYAGKAYLRTIFYTPAGNETGIASKKPEGNIYFYTPDSEGASAALKGVGGMNNNDFDGGGSSAINSVEDIIGMVEEGTMCVSGSGAKTSFWWNPKAIYEKTGSLGRNMHDFTEGITDCIGVE